MAKSIPIAPKPPKHHASSGHTPSSSGSGGSGSSSYSSSSGGGGGHKPSDPYAAAQARADAKERKANRKSANRNLQQAETLGLQAKALRAALGAGGFKHALDIKLANVNLSVNEQEKLLTDEYNSRVDALAGAAKDNEKAADGQSIANLGNRANERRAAVSEVMNNGGGESDALKAQEMSLRNWSQNQNEVNRSYFDTLRSTNSALTDLTADTKTARMNNQQQATSDRAQLWGGYYDQMSDTYTQLGNVRGQQAEYYGLANEAVGSKKTRHRQKQASAESGDAFMSAARTAGKAYKDPGISPAIQNWQGHADFEGQLNGGGLETAVAPTTIKKPEGATLRKWS